MIGRKRVFNSQFENEQKVVQWEVLQIKKEQELILKFVSINSQFRQGVRLAIDVGVGYLEVNGICSREMYLWEDTAPQKVHIRCLSEEGLLSVYNIFDLGNDIGGIRSQMDSCGMLVECEDSKYTYRCNDVGFETNFDKLVFQIEVKN